MVKPGSGGPRCIALAFVAFAGLLVFAPQAVAQPVVPSTTTVEASPAQATTGQQGVLTATVTCPGFPPGGGLGVTFFDGPDLLDTVPVGANGQATLTTSFDTPGAHTITAVYNGSQNCSASIDTTTVQVSEAPTPPNGVQVWWPGQPQWRYPVLISTPTRPLSMT
jgi:Bacterial Ig-like domain (group 3)